MWKKLMILVFGGLAVSGLLFWIWRKFLGLDQDSFDLCLASTASLDSLRQKNFGVFPVEIPEDEFEGWVV